MNRRGNKHRHRILLFSGILLAWFGHATAQEAQPEAPADPGEAANEQQTLDEIVVTAQKPGDRRRVETPYEDLMRQRLIEEMDTMRREQEEIAWRRGPTVSQPSRINFGYRPQERSRDSRDTSLTDLPLENTKPATIFRFEF